MRTPCKYAHEFRYQRYVDDKERTVVRIECLATKEPFECDARRKEYCDRYKPKDVISDKLSWIPTDEYDEQYGDTYKCARCGKEIIGTSNYCPRCGYEYKPWDGTTFK